MQIEPISQLESNKRQILARLQHMLHDRVPQILHRELWDELDDFFTLDVAVISQPDYRKYLEYEKVILSLELFKDAKI